ncbi:MAG: TonB-dependent receptor [Carboxylicivirga sp.]|nr:TonB-dependent receptor [Carboxylicivirga sp.]
MKKSIRPYRYWYWQQKLLRRMKATCLILLLFVTLGFANTRAQEKVRIKVKNGTFQEVIKQIESQSELGFIYSSDELILNKRFNIDKSDVSIYDLLDELLKGESLVYRKVGNNIIIKSQTQTTRERYSQQRYELTGIVVDKSGEPVPGVNVFDKNNPQNGVITGFDGSYTLSLDSDEAVVVFSFIGFVKQEIQVSGRTNINITMLEESIGLNEVVAIGYGTAKKGDLTGSVAAVKGEDLQTIGNTTMGQTLKGQVSGMRVTQQSAQPGGGVDIKIRGTAAGASPLIIVDGIPMSTLWAPNGGIGYSTGSKESVLDHINPEDIADITVLKDASSTAIYGSRAAGGVILITTKRGSKGEDQVNVSFKSQSTAQVISQQPEIMDAREYMYASNDALLERWARKEGYAPYGDKQLPGREELVKGYENAHSDQLLKGWNYNPAQIDGFIGGTDWQDEISRMGLIQQHDLSINGGTKKSAYLISGGYMGNEGVLKNNNYERITGRMNYDIEFSKYFRGGVSSAYTVTNSDDAGLGGSHGVFSIYDVARGFDPVVPKRDENGDWSKSELRPSVVGPMEYLDYKFQTKKRNLLASAFLDIRPFDGLSVKTTVGYDYKSADGQYYIPSFTQAGSSHGGQAKIVKTDLNNYYVNSTATYNNSIGKHNFTAIVGWEYRTTTNTGMSAENRGFPYDDVLWNNLGLGTYERPIVGSYKNDSEAVSVISRINYNYDEKYFLTINYRHDGSSNFAPNKQYGNFGGISLAYRLSEEEFMQDLDWLSNLKIRFGAGVTGNEGSLTGTRTYYTAGRDYYFDGRQTPGIGLAVLGNPNLSWESQSDINLGFDLGFFNNKIGATVDIYERTIFDRIGKMQLMSYQEVNQMDFNTERIDKTRGVDFSFYANMFQQSDLKWTTQFTFTWYRDFTTKRDPSETYPVYDSEAYTWGNNWAYASDGIIRAGEDVPHMINALPGMIKIKDLNGYQRDAEGNVVYKDGKALRTGKPDGKIDEADVVNFGNGTPMPVGWANNLTYKNWDLGINMYGSFNNIKINNRYAAIGYTGPQQGANTVKTFNERYSLYNQTSSVPGMTQYESNHGWGDFYHEKFWYMRLENITLGYRLPVKNQKTIKGLRVFSSVNNIAVLTNFGGYDPEYNVFQYPSVTSFTFGVDLKF